MPLTVLLSSPPLLDGHQWYIELISLSFVLYFQIPSLRTYNFSPLIVFSVKDLLVSKNLKMTPTFDLPERRKQKFMLWVPAGVAGANCPYLVLGKCAPAPHPTVYEFSISPFVKSDQPDLWELDPKTIIPPLKDDTIYYYWCEITDLSPEGLGAIQVTDPLAYTIDYRSFIRTLCFKTIIIHSSRSSRYSSMSIVDFSVISIPLCSANTNSGTCWVTTSRLGASIIPYGPHISPSRNSGAGNEQRSATSLEEPDWISSAGNDQRPPNVSDALKLSN